MTIRDIANILVARHELTQADAEHFVQVMVEVIYDGLLSDRQVKIKGFGTFKVQTIKERSSVSISTGEKVVIGEHSKVTFTPEPIMKDLVNKPFSQFETVILDDDSPLLEGNVEIGLDDELTDEPSAIDDAPSEDEPAAVEPSAVDDAASADDSEVSDDAPPSVADDDAPSSADDNDATPASAVDDDAAPEEAVDDDASSADDPLPPTPSDTVSVDMVQHNDEEMRVDEADAPDVVVEETPSDTATPSDEPDNDNGPTVDDEQEDSVHEEEANRPPYRNILIYQNIVINVIIAAAFFTLGYLAKADGWFSMTSQQPPKPAAITQTMPKPRPAKPQPVKPQPKAAAVQKDTVIPKDTIVKEKQVEKKNATQQPKETREEIEAKKAAEQHEQMMQRFMANPITRTGAYNIIGVKEVVTAKKGQTLKDISRSHLGPGLESYVEVLNGFSEVKEGDKVKIPKLELKKAARKKLKTKKE